MAQDLSDDHTQTPDVETKPLTDTQTQTGLNGASSVHATNKLQRPMPITSSVMMPSLNLIASPKPIIPQVEPSNRPPSLVSYGVFPSNGVPYVQRTANQQISPPNSHFQILSPNQNGASLSEVQSAKSIEVPHSMPLLDSAAPSASMKSAFPRAQNGHTDLKDLRQNGNGETWQLYQTDSTVNKGHKPDRSVDVLASSKSSTLPRGSNGLGEPQQRVNGNDGFRTNRKLNGVPRRRTGEYCITYCCSQRELIS